MEITHTKRSHWISLIVQLSPQKSVVFESPEEGNCTNIEGRYSSPDSHL